MFCRLTKLIVFFCLLLLAEPVLCQQRQLTQHQRFGVEEGLPQSFISGIAQDKDGFLWLSTLDGLSRYDGRGFRNLGYQSKTGSGLSGNSIYFLLPQPNNSITLIYDGFLMDEFDMHTWQIRKLNVSEKLRSIPGAVWQLYNLDKLYNGRDWVFLRAGFNGIGWLNCNTGKVSWANKANGLLSQDTLSALLQTGDGRLYLVSEDGVQVSDTGKKSFETIRFPTTLEKMSLQPDGTGFFANPPSCFAFQK